MSTAILMCVLFFAKVVDNALSTTKTILVQRNHSILAGIALAASNFIYLCITKNVVNSDSYLALIVVSLASGVGCCMAVAVSSRLSKEKTYVNVIMSDDKEKMQAFRDFLAQHHITNTATDSYTHNVNGLICRQTATLCVKTALPCRNSRRFRCHIHFASGMVN